MIRYHFWQILAAHYKDPVQLNRSQKAFKLFNQFSISLLCVFSSLGCYTTPANQTCEKAEGLGLVLGLKKCTISAVNEIKMHTFETSVKSLLKS